MLSWPTILVGNRLEKCLEANNDDTQLESLQDKIDEYFVRMSQATGYNLSALMEFWGVPLSQVGKSRMSQGPNFLPDDEITKKVPAVSRAIASSHPNCVRQVAKPSGSTAYSENLGAPVVPLPMVRIKGVTCMS